MPLCVTSEASALVLAISVTAVGLLLTADSVEMCRRKGLVDLWCYFHNFFSPPDWQGEAYCF